MRKWKSREIDRIEGLGEERGIVYRKVSVSGQGKGSFGSANVESAVGLATDHIQVRLVVT